MSDKTEALKELHTRVIDAINGLKDAQDDLSGNARTFVDRCLSDREEFHGEIHRQLTAEGIDVDEKGSTSAAAHRGLFNLRNAISGGDDAVLKECARGDEHLKEAYDEAIKATEGDPQWSFLTAQRSKVEAAIDEAQAKAA